jgi:hypothetical protein
MTAIMMNRRSVLTEVARAGAFRLVGCAALDAARCAGSAETVRRLGGVLQLAADCTAQLARPVTCPAWTNRPTARAPCKR